MEITEAGLQVVAIGLVSLACRALLWQARAEPYLLDK